MSFVTVLVPCASDPARLVRPPDRPPRGHRPSSTIQTWASNHHAFIYTPRTAKTAASLPHPLANTTFFANHFPSNPLDTLHLRKSLSASLPLTIFYAAKDISNTEISPSYHHALPDSASKSPTKISYESLPRVQNETPSPLAPPRPPPSPASQHPTASTPQYPVHTHQNVSAPTLLQGTTTVREKKAWRMPFSLNSAPLECYMTRVTKDQKRGHGILRYPHPKNNTRRTPSLTLTLPRPACLRNPANLQRQAAASHIPSSTDSRDKRSRYFHGLQYRERSTSSVL